MQRLSDISTIRAVMEKNGFSFSKALGQNFLINPSVCPRMAEMSGAADCAGAIEVGPGLSLIHIYGMAAEVYQMLPIIEQGEKREYSVIDIAREAADRAYGQKEDGKTE